MIPAYFSVAQTLLSLLLGFPPNAAQASELEGAPSFAPFAKGGLLRPDATIPPLLSWVPLLCVLCVLCDLCVSFLFLFNFQLSTFNSHLALPEPT